MIDEKLRKRMEKAYVAGNYTKALHLSQKLDTLQENIPDLLWRGLGIHAKLYASSS